MYLSLLRKDILFETFHMFVIAFMGHRNANFSRLHATISSYQIQTSGCRERIACVIHTQYSKQRVEHGRKHHSLTLSFC